MDNHNEHEVLLAFKHRGRAIQLKASAKGWAQMYLKQNPWSSSRRSSRADWEQNALRQGHIAVNSILRDWMKGRITAIECGILSFEAVFMPYMLATDGRPLIERLAESNVLPAAEEAKVVTLPGPHSGGCPLSFAHPQLQLRMLSPAQGCEPVTFW
jgi:hypothetical protein